MKNTVGKNRAALLLVPAAVGALVLAGCSSDASDGSGASGASGASDASDASATDTAASATHAADTTATDSPTIMSCPSDAPADDVPAQWEVDGTTGSVSVLGQTDTTAPRITVDSPFTVDETRVETLDAGGGQTVTDQSTVLVCYLGVDGRDGSTFDSAYERGTPAQFPASGVVPGFRDALVGQTVGSSVAVVMPPEDGYGQQGQPRAGIQGGDSLIFALKILAAK